MSQEGYLLGASIFRASQAGDILRVKELITRGVSVNRTNAYGCNALHYAVKHAADCATRVARGGEEQISDGVKVRRASSYAEKSRNRCHNNIVVSKCRQKFGAACSVC